MQLQVRVLWQGRPWYGGLGRRHARRCCGCDDDVMRFGDDLLWNTNIYFVHACNEITTFAVKAIKTYDSHQSIVLMLKYRVAWPMICTRGAAIV
jgi:hypothetical protein